MQEYQGRIGIGDGWLLVFAEPFVDEPVIDDELTFSNENLLLLPKLIPVQPGTSDQWLLDWNRSAAAKAVVAGPDVEDLGAIDGAGWSGSLARQQLTDTGEWQLMSFLAAPRACLHFTVRFRDRGYEAAARHLIESVEHDAAGANEMNRVLRQAREAEPPV